MVGLGLGRVEERRSKSRLSKTGKFSKGVTRYFFVRHLRFGSRSSADNCRHFVGLLLSPTEKASFAFQHGSAVSWQKDTSPSFL